MPVDATGGWHQLFARSKQFSERLFVIRLVLATLIVLIKLSAAQQRRRIDFEFVGLQRRIIP